MRPIYLARVDKVRPVLLLTREGLMPHLRSVTVAPITNTIRGLSTEVAVGAINGLDHDSVVSCDNVKTIRVDQLLERVGFLLARQEAALTAAIHAAYDLEALQR